jgi:hypothetical protein
MEEIYKDSFWTGYYTSRANSKKMMREFSGLGYMTSTLYSLDRLRFSQFRSENTDLKLERNNSWDLFGQMGLLQHHDTITGTSF